MKLRLLLICIVVLSGGCRRGAYRQLAYDTLVAENRLLEDEKYRWKNDYEDAVDEIDRLRDEIEELKSGGSSVLAPGRSSRAADSEPRNLFPSDVPDLDIDQGMPEGDDPRTEDNKTIEDDGELDDLEPPKLDLGGGELSGSPAPSAPQSARWTPRTQQRPDPPAAHVRLADQHSEATSGASRQGSKAASSSPPPDRQARQPRWRPYR